MKRVCAGELCFYSEDTFLFHPADRYLLTMAALPDIADHKGCCREVRNARQGGPQEMPLLHVGCLHDALHAIHRRPQRLLRQAPDRGQHLRRLCGCQGTPPAPTAQKCSSPLQPQSCSGQRAESGLRTPFPLMAPHPGFDSAAAILARNKWEGRLKRH